MDGVCYTKLYYANAEIVIFPSSNPKIFKIFDDYNGKSWDVENKNVGRPKNNT